jgi:hypothetical protein
MDFATIRGRLRRGFTALACGGAVVAALAPSVSEAAVVSLFGSGGAVPNGNAAGATFDIVTADASVIAANGNNVSLTLLNVVHNHMVDLTVTLEHVGFGGSRVVFDLVLDNGSFVCGSSMNGDYTFRSGAATTLRSACSANGTGFPSNNTVTVPSGTYLTTLGDDVTDSGMSSAWNGQQVAGTWRLFVSDSQVSADSPGNALNTNWQWRLDIQTAGPVQIPEPGTLGLALLPLAGLLLQRRVRRTVAH